MTRVVSFADGFTSATSPVVSGASQENYTLNNNQSTSDIAGLIYSSSQYKSIFIDYELERVGSTTYRQAGSFLAVFNGTWTLTFGNFQGDSIIEDTLLNTYSVVLSIDSSTGQIRYSSGNQVGHTSTKFKVYSTKVSV
ncbi:MAG: hypothetical protein HUM72_12670 [Dolichospermum sp.]|nr:hypothetical protein [Dolichospermum sp.]